MGDRRRGKKPGLFFIIFIIVLISLIMDIRTWAPGAFLWGWAA
jgi:hypothetical protein